MRARNFEPTVPSIYSLYRAALASCEGIDVKSCKDGVSQQQERARERLLFLQAFVMFLTSRRVFSPVVCLCAVMSFFGDSYLGGDGESALV